MKKDSPIRILVADDHPVVREGLVVLLNCQPDMEVIAEAANGKEAIATFQKHRPDLAVMDLIMPGMKGPEVIKEICRIFKDARILILTSYHGQEDIYSALRAGARGYILKSAPTKELLEAVRAVYGGKRFVPPEVAATLAERIPTSDLTPREMDVLRLIVRGMSNKQIADVLSLSEGTVKNHVNLILAKLGVQDRTEACSAAIQRGIIHLE